MEKTDVIALLIYKDGKILVEKRMGNKNNDPGKIVIPGGHVEKGETLEKTCQRELKEELGVSCQEFKFIAKSLHHATVEDQMTYYFFCRKWKGNPANHEAEKIFWISHKQLGLLDFEKDKKIASDFFESLVRK